MQKACRVAYHMYYYDTGLIRRQKVLRSDLTLGAGDTLTTRGYS